MIYCNHIVILLLLCGKFIDVIKAENTNIKTEKTQERNGKVFSLFSIVTFPNQGCASQSTIGSKARNGTCFTSTECTEKGGKFSGNCAAGFGVCCLFITQTSGTTISQNCSYIQNPNFPSAYGSETAATYTIAKCSNEVCTLRLDFETFTTAGPTTTSDAAASVDSLAITTTPAQSLGIPNIGGENSGYHAYVEIGPDAGATATLSFTFGSSTLARMWDIKVTQVECTNRSRPPAGCQQYFTHSTGRIESYNFPGSNSIFQHLDNQNYKICIRDNGYRCILYTKCAETPTFSLSGNGATGKAKVGTNCALDWIEIDGAHACNAALGLPANFLGAGGRLCGENYGAIDTLTAAMGIANVCDCTKPFDVHFVANAAAGDAGAMTVQRGFCLEYKQFN